MTRRGPNLGDLTLRWQLVEMLAEGLILSAGASAALLLRPPNTAAAWLAAGGALLALYLVTMLGLWHHRLVRLAGRFGRVVERWAAWRHMASEAGADLASLLGPVAVLVVGWSLGGRFLHVFVVLELLWVFWRRVQGRRGQHRPLGMEIADSDSRLPSLQAMVEGLGIRVDAVHVLKASAGQDSMLLGAMSDGPRRVLVVGSEAMDLLSGPQLGALLLHEAGHWEHNHLVKQGRWTALTGYAALAVLASGGVWLLDHWPRGQGLVAPASVLLLAWWAIMTLCRPVLLAVSKSHERQAHLWALRHGAKPEDYASALERLAEVKQLARRSPLWARLLFNTHPSLEESLELIHRPRTVKP